MKRMGNCWDNTPMESFFSTLKHELIHHEYIEVVNNRQRKLCQARLCDSRSFPGSTLQDKNCLVLVSTVTN